MQIEEEAKKFVTKGLVNVVKDIELAALNLDQLLQMQDMSLESVSCDVSLIKARLQAMKSQHLIGSLEEMKLPYVSAGSSSSGSNSGGSGGEGVSGPGPAVREVEVDYAAKKDSGSSVNPSSAVAALDDKNGSSGGTLVGTLKREKLSLEQR
jgi:hypothetical protein